MPLETVFGQFEFPVETTEDVAALLDWGALFSDAWSSERQAKRDMWDHLYYVGAVKPQLALPLQHRFCAFTDHEVKIFEVGFGTWLSLLHDADDECVHLLEELHEDSSDWRRETMLAAICTEAALNALATHARRSGRIRQLRMLGFAIPEVGPAEPRFLMQRRAIEVIPFEGPFANLLHARHPIGLAPASLFSNATPESCSWHYLSLDCQDVEELSSCFSKLHLVSPALDRSWTLWYQIRGENNRILGVTSYVEEGDDNTPQTAAAGDDGLYQARLVPYDDSLTYRNQHVWFDNVCGTVGGPPIGYYEKPNCPECCLLMIHVLTIVPKVHHYGEGYRHLFVCPDCQTVACNASNWS